MKRDESERITDQVRIDPIQTDETGRAPIQGEEAETESIQEEESGTSQLRIGQTGASQITTEQIEPNEIRTDACKTDAAEPSERQKDEEEQEREQILYAVLFTLGRAAEPSELAKACGCTAGTVKKTILRIKKRMEERDGAILLREFDGAYQLCTNPKYYQNLIQLVKAPKKPVLTEVVLETLAIIACNHPATKVEIEKIRGVKSDHAVNKLIEYGLVEESGRLDAPGRPALFEPTEEFYRRFGVQKQADLPAVGTQAEERIREEVEEEVREETEDQDAQEAQEEQEAQEAQKEQKAQKAQGNM